MNNYATTSSVVYRAIVTSKFRTEKMLNFYEMVGDTKDKNTIYMTFGRSTPWAANEKDPGFAPPYPIDNPDGVSDMWQHMLGTLKIDKSMLDAVVPRRDWGDDRYQNPKTFYIGDIVVVGSISENTPQTYNSPGWQVYRCVDVPDVGECSITSIKEKKECIALGGKWTPGKDSVDFPTAKSDGSKEGDGYIWEYLYTIPYDVTINRCTNEYIVVPMPDELSDPDPVINREKRQRWGYDNNISWNPQDSDLLYNMKVNTIRFKAFMDSIYFPEASLPGNTGFRQISLIINPLEKKKSPSDKDVKATKVAYKPQQLELHSGEMIYMENRQPIIRSMDATEEISIIFQF
ncbi:baseplate wedge tail fiber connector [Cronobacter phage vB_Cdu_VP8]|nr:baseplate wedge tail fiber connector [Cronobacter phage vB_Cdu_VP8]